MESSPPSFFFLCRSGEEEEDEEGEEKEEGREEKGTREKVNLTAGTQHGRLIRPIKWHSPAKKTPVVSTSDKQN